MNLREELDQLSDWIEDRIQEYEISGDERDTLNLIHSKLWGILHKHQEEEGKAAHQNGDE